MFPVNIYIKKDEKTCVSQFTGALGNRVLKQKFAIIQPS